MLKELVKKMKKSGAKAYLVNTGWNGTGKRISIKDTRGIIDAILDGSINKAPTRRFLTSTSWFLLNCRVLIRRFSILATLTPMRLPVGREGEDLAGRFIKNFAKFTGNEAGKALVAAGPKL